MSAGLDDRGLPPGYPFQAEYEITPRRAHQGMQAGSVRLVDCRTRAEWESAHIEGATLIPLDELQSRLSEIEAMEDDGATVAVHCHFGGRSLKATLFLRQQGINALSVAGGIDLWARDIDSSIPRYAP